MPKKKIDKLPIVSGTDVVKALQRLGFFLDRQRGSHAVLKKFAPQGERGCVIPMHREVALGTLRRALIMAGVSPEEFKDAL
jgi:predicted RNA binding protein YcfA (HicA-like mRNA interferase family)